MSKKLLTSILVFLILAGSFLLAGEVHAERAIWVWGMAKDIVLDTTAKTAFFNFCAAPHGNGTKVITRVFLDAKPYGFNLMTYNGGTDLRNFLTEAHNKGMKVEFLSGDKLWAIPEYRAEAEAIIDGVLAFNSGTADANKRFDGIQYDVEPYLLNSKLSSDPLDWQYDKPLIWDTYLTLLTNCQAKVNTYNTAYNPDIRFGAAIPFWYTAGEYQAVINTIDYIAIMSYRDSGSQIINVAQDEIWYADAVGKKVFVGVETGHPTDNTDFPPSTTFYEEGNSLMETNLSYVNLTFAGNSSYQGIAIHYYEDLIGPKGFEAAYRTLWTTSNPYRGHVPIVAVLSPTRAGEIWVGTLYIQWDASDLDGNSMTIDIQYSSNGGSTWTSLSNNDAEGQPKSVNDGKYAWNTTGMSGSNYLIKVIATDNSAYARTGYDLSNNTFTISNTLSPTDITNLHLWNENSSSLRLKWTPPLYTPKNYKIYRSVNGGSFSLYADNVIAISKYIDSSLSNSTKYKYQLKPVYGTGAQGNLSNPSNMLIPGSEFLLDYCENNEGIAYGGPYGPSAPGSSASFDTVNKKEGNQSFKVTYNYTTGWGAVWVGTLPVPTGVDISPYFSVKFWAKSNQAVAPAVKLQLTEVGVDNETWDSPAVSIGTTWAEYVLDFSQFARSSAIGNDRLDEHSIVSYGLLFGSGTAGTYTYNFDQLRFIGPSGTVSITPASINFGTLSATLSDHRFSTGPISIGYGGLGSPWTIRIWTNNGTGPDIAGLVGVSNPAIVMPLKVWCANYGPATPPDPEDDQYWVNNETGYFRIPEDDEMDPGNPWSWRRLCWSGAELTNPFDIYLAVDAMGKSNQVYQTTTLTVEYINE